MPTAFNPSHSRPWSSVTTDAPRDAVRPIPAYTSIALKGLLLLAIAGSAMAVEQPRYSVEIREPPFEVRDYEPAIVAQVHVTGDRNEAVSAGFRILAGYIFGDNPKQTKIAMTAPVTQSPGQAFPATGPVEQSGAAAGWEVRFTMPASYELDTLPPPRDSRIHLLRLPGRRVAVITFSGFWSDSNLQTHQAQLQAFLEKHRFTALSAPVYAYYDPPWMPWLMRTNEVMADIAGQ